MVFGFAEFPDDPRISRRAFEAAAKIAAWSTKLLVRKSGTRMGANDWERFINELEAYIADPIGANWDLLSGKGSEPVKC